MTHAAFQNNARNFLPHKEVGLTAEFLRSIANGAIAPGNSHPCFWNDCQTILNVCAVFDSVQSIRLSDILHCKTKGPFQTISSYSRNLFSAAFPKTNWKCKLHLSLSIDANISCLFPSILLKPSVVTFAISVLPLF